jgi:hypothetical protein
MKDLEQLFEDYERLDEYVTKVKGHKNSKGESAPWVIKDHDTGKILSSHKTKEAAESHLQDMHAHK